MDGMVKKALDRSAVYSALLTPYDKHGELDVTMLRKLVRHEEDSGVEGFYCCWDVTTTMRATASNGPGRGGARGAAAWPIRRCVA